MCSALTYRQFKPENYSACQSVAFNSLGISKTWSIRNSIISVPSHSMKKFRYKQLDLGQLSFRLVRLEMGLLGEVEYEIIHSTLDENVIPYEAVSYRWGSPLKTNSILVQGRRLDVTSNLYHILRDLRYSKADRYLWIDAICINQEDVIERGKQVHRMKYIYNRAERVIFFIGRPTKYTDILLASLAELQNKTWGNNWNREDENWDEAWDPIQQRLENQFPYARGLLRRALIYLMEQSWFRRVWILPEVGNARSAVVHCGRAFVSARVFAVTPRLLGINPSSHHQAVFDLMPGPSRQPSSLKRDFCSLLQRFSGAEAQDERDKIYALLAMCTISEGSHIIPNYSSSIQDVIRDTILYIWHYDTHNLPEAPYKTMDSFLAGLTGLNEMVFMWTLDLGDIDGICHIIKQGGDHITITEGIFRAIPEDELVQEQIIEALLQKRINRASIAIGSKNLLNWIKLDGFENSCSRFFLNDAKEINMGGYINGQTPLLVATKHGHVGAVQFLLHDGANIEAVDGDGNNPLLLASRQGNIEILEILLSSGAYIDPVDWNGDTPLSLAFMQGDLEVIKLLMSCGGSLQAKGDNKRLQWIYNLSRKCGEASLIRLSNGVFMEIGNAYGRAPLMSAIRQGNTEVVRLILEHCPNIKAMIMTKDIYEQTPLLFAVQAGNPEIVQLLVSHGSDIEARNRLGITALGLAITHGSDVKVRILMNNGADIEAKDYFGRTPLLLAIKAGFSSIIEILLEKFSDCEAKMKRDQAEKEIRNVKALFSRDNWPWNHAYYMIE